MDFKKLTIDDIEIIRPFFKYSLSNKCDNTVGASVMWADYFNTEYTVINNTIIFKASDIDYGEYFTVPIGDDVMGGLRIIYDYCKEKKISVQFSVATERDIECLEKVFILEKQELNDWADYIYEASDLINLSGRKYHGQKNHINFFKKNFPNYSYEEINSENIKKVEKFLQEFAKTENKDSILFDIELNKTFEVLKSNSKYKLLGLILKVDGKIVAFSMGEKVKNTLFVHIEKADKNYRGSYPMMMNEFAKRYAYDMKYINREEDAGDIGLKNSKLQYHPCTILDKYFVKVIDKK